MVKHQRDHFEGEPSVNSLKLSDHTPDLLLPLALMLTDSVLQVKRNLLARKTLLS
jgi:hypothetical protein